MTRLLPRSPFASFLLAALVVSKGTNRRSVHFLLDQFCPRCCGFSLVISLSLVGCVVCGVVVYPVPWKRPLVYKGKVGTMYKTIALCRDQALLL